MNSLPSGEKNTKKVSKIDFKKDSFHHNAYKADQQEKTAKSLLKFKFFALQEGKLISHKLHKIYIVILIDQNHAN